MMKKTSAYLMNAIKETVDEGFRVFKISFWLLTLGLIFCGQAAAYVGENYR